MHQLKIPKKEIEDVDDEPLKSRLLKVLKNFTSKVLKIQSKILILDQFKGKI